MKYKEIRELHEYCVEIGIEATLERFLDGYAVRFGNRRDFVQHSGSYGSGSGCVEPAIGCDLDYTPVTLEEAKRLVEKYKDKLSLLQIRRRRTTNESNFN